MYADLGHFGARPIRIGWFAVVFPALLLNYLGQGAYLLSGAPVAGGKLFYSLAPAPLLLPLVVLATLATIVASQALISGAFSLTWQAIGLGLFPRLDVLHTHRAHAGQIYIPITNWGLYLGCVALVLAFGSSSALAAAYGLAVAGVMLITSLAMFAIARRYWRWGAARTALVWGPLTAVNGAFLIASSVKFLEGGVVPLSVGVAAFLTMATWSWGRKATFGAYAARSTLTMAEVVALHRSGTAFLERNALIMSPLQVRHPTDRAPALVGLLWERYRHTSAQLDPRRSDPPQSPLYPRKPLSRDRLRPRQGPRQRHRRRTALWLHGGAERRALSRGDGAAQGDRPADPSAAMDRPCLPRELASRQADEPFQTAALPPVSVPAPRLSPRLLRLWPWRRSAAFRGGHAGQGAISGRTRA